MKQNHKLIITGVAIAILSMLDYQFFTEQPYCYMFTEGQRRSFHIFCMAASASAGYWTWKDYYLPWVKKVWVSFYAAAAGIMLLTGVLQAVLHVFSQNFLNGISAIRMFFCTPVPFFIVTTLLKALRQNSYISR